MSHMLSEGDEKNLMFLIWEW